MPETFMCRCGPPDGDGPRQAEAVLTWAYTHYGVDAESEAKYGRFLLLDRMMNDLGFGLRVTVTIDADMWFGIASSIHEGVAHWVEADHLIDGIAATAKWWRAMADKHSEMTDDGRVWDVAAIKAEQQE